MDDGICPLCDKIKKFPQKLGDDMVKSVVANVTIYYSIDGLVYSMSSLGQYTVDYCPQCGRQIAHDTGPKGVCNTCLFSPGSTCPRRKDQKVGRITNCDQWKEK